MSITGEGRFATNPILVRYKRAATMTHANIRSLIIPLSSPEQDRGVAAFQPAAIAGRFPDWSNDIWYTYQCFVGGLAWATTDQILHKAFSQYDEIIDSKIIKDRETGRSRGLDAQTNFTKPPVSKQHTRDAKCHFVGIDIFNGKKLEDIVPSSHNCDVPHVNRVDYQLIDMSEDGFVSLLTENGNTKDDMRLPTDDSLLLRLKMGLATGRTLWCLSCLAWERSRSVPLRTLALKIEYDAIAVANKDFYPLCMCNKLIRWYFSYEIETRKACNGGGGKDPENVDSLMKGNLWNQQCGLTIVMSIWFFILLKRGSLNRKFSTAQSSILENN
ncbi:TRANSLATION INITIATION FACTOR 5A FAMILY MEMBER [Salix koriyanagi]|uniref:TRANSLATION INITIATION FACTOR 5A FAMILY MEMBER n=1 Tax=Salix koriyanagi TaxID=2511006 RepID=A0A9Q0W1J5_9ROSI|nr:TRANSLATION INITIATION FACTOR 5A FAMILY MEMBER [Salix koriyanagi]